MYSLDDFDQSKACDTPFEFELKHLDRKKGTGIFVKVIGGQSQKILDFSKRELNDRRVSEKLNEKRDPRGKNPKVVTVEEDIEFSTALVALRVVAWRGFKEPYSHDSAVRLLTMNSDFKEQILEVSEDMQHFPLPFQTTSPFTPDIQLG